MAYVHRDRKKTPKKRTKEKQTEKQTKRPTGCLGRFMLWLLVSVIVLVLGVYVAIRIVEYLMAQPLVH